MSIMNCCNHDNLIPTEGWPIDCLYTTDAPNNSYNRRKLYICANCNVVLAIPDDEFNRRYNKYYAENRIILKEK